MQHWLVPLLREVESQARDSLSHTKVPADCTRIVGDPQVITETAGHFDGTALPPRMTPWKSFGASRATARQKQDRAGLAPASIEANRVLISAVTDDAKAPTEVSLRIMRASGMTWTVGAAKVAAGGARGSVSKDAAGQLDVQVATIALEISTFTSPQTLVTLVVMVLSEFRSNFRSTLDCPTLSPFSSRCRTISGKTGRTI